MNKSIVLGNLGQTPKLRSMPDGTPVTTVSVCTNETTGSGDNRTEVPVWYKADFFGNSAEIIAKHFQKGDPIYVEGRLLPELWEGDDGVTRLNLKLNRCEFQFPPKRNRTNDQAAGETTNETNGEPPDPTKDDIPF